MANGDSIARALQGFGAGIAGQGPQFLASLEQQEQMLDEQRRQALLEDSFTVMRNLQDGNIDGARGVLQQRLEAIRQLGGNPEDTMEVLGKIESGDISGALSDVGTVVEFGRAQGLLDIPQPRQQVIGGQVVSIDPQTGQATATPIGGFQQDEQRLRDQELRARQLALSEREFEARDVARQQGLALRERGLELGEEREKRQSEKISGGLEGALLRAQEDAVKFGRQLVELNDLAANYEKQNIQGGLKSTVTETLKRMLGSQDAVTEFKRRFSKVRLQEGLKLLPPGQVTDKDMEEAFRGVPPENASAKQVKAFLGVAAKIASYQAGFNSFKSEFISTKSTGKGLIQEWEKSFESPVLDRRFTVGELYATAKNKGLTVPEVAEQLGIENIQERLFQ